MVCFQQKPFIPSQTAARWFASIDFPHIHLLVSQKFNDLQKNSYEIFSKSVTKISKSVTKISKGVTCFSKRCPICDRAAIFVRKEGVHPNLLQMPNGQLYLLWSGWPERRHETETQCIYIARMENPWTTSSNRVMISLPDHEWERQWINPDGHRSAYPIYVNENPEAFACANNPTPSKTFSWQALPYKNLVTLF